MTAIELATEDEMASIQIDGVDHLVGDKVAALFHALLKERDALKQVLAITQKNLDDTFGNMLEAQEERDALKRQHKDCLEQKEALRERAETLELGYRGFP